MFTLMFVRIHRKTLSLHGSIAVYPVVVRQRYFCRHSLPFGIQVCNSFKLLRLNNQLDNENSLKSITILKHFNEQFMTIS